MKKQIVFMIDGNGVMTEDTLRMHLADKTWRYC